MPHSLRLSGLIWPLAGLVLVCLAVPRCPAQAEAKVKAIAVSPKPLVIYINQRQPLSARIEFEGAADPDLKPTWSIAGPIGAIDADGVFTAGPQRAIGTISATAGGQTDTADVWVVPYAYGACHADGRIVYSVQDGGDSEYDLMLMESDGSNPRNLTPNPAEPPEGYDLRLNDGLHPCWSPDGQAIVFETGGSAGDPSAIALMDADGGNRRIIARSPTLAYYRPTFSPDGKTILFDARPVAEDTTRGPGDIYAMGADGSNLRKLTADPAGEEDACWSPDGQSIAFVRERETPDGVAYELWTMAADGRGAMRVSPAGDVWYLHPAWSPDGASIACTIRAGGGLHRVGLIPATGGAARELPGVPDVDQFGPAFTWDGSGVLSATTDAPGLTREIWLQPVAGGGAPQAVTHRADVGNYLRSQGYAY